MARTDGDSWGITESVGATALGVAWSRALEQNTECPLFTDPYAQMFVDAAVEQGWQPPPAQMAERIRSIAGYAASRTKWFDEFFIAAGANGIDQVVILAAGLDARAWRLPWIGGTVVYEIDQPRVLAFKVDTMRRHEVRPTARYIPVPIDLREDWPRALRDAGFDASEPTAWAAEGLLPYLPASGQDLLFERIHRLSARGSRVGVESFDAGFFEPGYLESRRQRLAEYRRQAGEEDPNGAGGDAFDVQDLWYTEERTEVTAWLTDHGWDVTSIGADDLMDRYGRCAAGEPDDTTPRTAFVEGQRAC
ncbi:SAM-dependent methyltransferase [Mycolicibacterium novocastrense]|uniref:SAM-dependent methyltransferase n=1 Tax=Mycolicibacterium novocastrense TaxID=59813 RepID=UPI00074954F2|nr:SAM-dependent methyltransferase [Mycolicibacterium novocastrense]KUH67357.1 SAM-dependent methyltransferase [Mycolicibacterium novocastrense]KUH68110.1 SAM-dependent methyltransferase [Mycolicibacterium novocastrense]KUH76285.1 SAM-dependent methyltransferase [Mycolicibacterium novocastrense]